MFILPLILALLGSLMLIRPALFWTLTESWKSNDAAEPSDLYLFSTRFGGVILSLIGIGVIVAYSIL